MAESACPFEQGSCVDVLGNRTCLSALVDPQRGSVRAGGLFLQPSCLNAAGDETGFTAQTLAGNCLNVLTRTAYAINGGAAPAPAVQEKASSLAATLTIYLLYFLVPLAYFLLVLLLRRKLYKRFLDDATDPGRQLEPELAHSDSNQPADEQTLPLYLSFHDLSYSVKLNKAGIKQAKAANGGKAPSKPGWDQKRILKRITGVFRPGTLSAIMGPSGCGKSTLLDVLADRKHGGTTTGRVLVNGRPRSSMFKRLSGYVMQFDALFPYLTVRELLTYTAELRLTGTDWAAKRRAVRRVIHDLDLKRVADTQIGGNGVPGISGGQARRVTVGVELVTRPLILFLDEPTTGLDAFSSLQLVRTLRLLADTGRTVVATIHQPRPDIFDLFNTLLLMKDGEVAYMGSVRQIRPYFATLGIEIPPADNVADFVVDLTYSKEGADLTGSADVVGTLASSYKSSPAADALRKLADSLKLHTLQDLPPPAASEFGPCDDKTGELLEASNHHRFSQPLLYQVFVLLRRSYKNIGRDTTYFTNIGLQMSQFLFYGLLFLGLRTQDTDGVDAGERLGIYDVNYLMITQKRAFIFQVMNTVMLIEVVVISTAFVEKTIFRREHASGAYSVAAYHLQFMVRFFVDAIWKGYLAAVLCYFFPPMRLTPGAFFYFGAVLTVASTLGSALAFLMVSLVPNAEGAANVHAQILGTFGLYSGFFLFPNLIPVWMQWLYYMLPFKYSFEGLELNEFTCMTVGEQDDLFAVDPSLDRWLNLLVFMFYPPILHGAALLASFAHTRPKSFWVKTFPCCFQNSDPSPQIVAQDSSEGTVQAVAQPPPAAESAPEIALTVT